MRWRNRSVLVKVLVAFGLLASLAYPVALRGTSAQDVANAGSARSLESLSVQTVTRGGGQGRVRVCLDGPAPTGGVAVRITTNRPSVIPSPGDVTIPAGSDCLRISVSAGNVRYDVPVNIIVKFGPMKLVQQTIVRDFSGPPPATSTPTNTPTATSTATNTPVPPTATNTATNTPVLPTATNTATNTPVPPTATNTPVPPTATNTPVPPTATSTATPTLTATNTATATSTATSTATAIATSTATSTATATNTPVPVLAFSFTILSGDPGTGSVPEGGSVVFNVCLDSGSPPVVAQFQSTATQRASIAPVGGTFTAVGECQQVTLTDLIVPGQTTSGLVSVRVVVGAETFTSPAVRFSGTPDPL